MISRTTEVFVGLDLGTTTTKALVRDINTLVSVIEAPTPWHTYPGGRTETSAEELLTLAVQLIGQAVQAAEVAIGSVHVLGLAVTGFAESGVLLDKSGCPSAPVIAWFDKRGQQEVDALNALAPGFADRFAGKTGLPWDSQASIAKLMWLRDQGTPITTATRWLSVPEWIVHQLGGDQVREPSLASRTGLIDQNTGAPWHEGLSAARLPSSLLPPALGAGRRAGRLSRNTPSAVCEGAALTVAGHDHLAAALGAGAVGPHELFNSSGTADVVARSLPGQLDDRVRHFLVASGLSAGQHILPDTTIVLGGVRGGLLLRRVLTALGADAPEQRAALDAASLTVAVLPPGLEITGAGPTGNEVIIRLQDHATPAALWAAATRYAATETRMLLSSIERIVGPHHRAVASGGWTRMSSVRAAKSSAIDHLTFSPETQPGVTGAALLAMYAASDGSLPLSDFVVQAIGTSHATSTHV
jgi:sugar (pentulose or hexulose) kinase